ncbi:MAG: amino acid-binding protein [Deltaproteobacteria bacterium RIFCSPLOWO2_02_FULL_57_26]|nr:MAG: amino acid-binding protein [Deltaproteobacteria bacterium RIFCSPLOWO2_02_FULL_57_26]OGQ83950.1 MAG: amino acid-binding protein [Deltaproteobacteria bacterium RIFCSPLOWO2_12_FULL_57_22]
MPYSIRKIDVWAAEIEDRPGGLAEKLEALAKAGASLEFIISRRAPDKPGKGVVFLTPVRGAKQTRAAIDAGLGTTDSLHSLRVEGPDRPGLGTKMTRALADAGINLRGLSAAALGRKSVAYFAFDSADDAANAIKLLRKALK